MDNFCEQCGTLLLEGSKFCEVCGHPVPAISLEPDLTASSQTPIEPPAHFCEHCGAQLPGIAHFCQACGHPVAAVCPRKERKSPPVLFILAAAVALLILGGGIVSLIWFLQKTQPVAFKGGDKPPPAGERILSFASHIQVDPNGPLTVTETIVVRGRGDQIKRGIIRNLPTEYKDRKGNTIQVGFQIVEIRRDGRPEQYHTKNVDNGVEIFIGQQDVLLQPKKHTYTLTYKTYHPIDHFGEFDELYWNVTGNSWSFAIDAAQAVVQLPPGAKIQRYAAYTGPSGVKGTDYQVKYDSDGNILFTTTRGLAPREGLTISVAWTGGIVQPTDQPPLDFPDPLPNLRTAKISYSPNKQYVAIIKLDSDGEIPLLRVVDLQTKKLLSAPKKITGDINGFEWHPNKSILVYAIAGTYAEGDVPGIYLWDVGVNKIKQLVKSETGNSFDSNKIIFQLKKLSHDGDIIYFSTISHSDGKEENYEIQIDGISPVRREKVTPTPPLFNLTAIIDDPDGYTNVRREKSATSEIVTKVYQNEEFFTYAQSGDWWQIKTRAGIIGYMHVSRIKIVAGKSTSGVGGPRWPWTSERNIRKEDLSGLSKSELELMRNEIYARHGWVFKRDDLRRYFESQSWYRPKGTLARREQANILATAEMTPIEQSNAKFIRNYEESKGRTWGHDDAVAPPTVETSLDQVLLAFERALRTSNSQEILSAFSHTSPWRFISYDIITGRRLALKSVTFAQLEKDFKTRQGWWHFFIGDPDGDANYATQFMHGIKWRRQGNTFFVDSIPKNYLKWRQEEGRWVIAEIGLPAP